MPRSNLPTAALCAALLLSSCGDPSPGAGSPGEAASGPASAHGESPPAPSVPGAGGSPSGRPLFVYTRGADECPGVPGGAEVFCDSGDPAVPTGLYDVAAVYRDGRARVLTDDHVSAGGRLSPDGTRVAFASGERIVEDRNGEVVARYALHVMDADGTDRRRLADLGPGLLDVPVDGDLAWSPDGRRIAFGRHGAYYGPGGVAVVDSDGGGRPRQLVPEGADPVWSPDGRRIAFTGPDSTPTGESSTVGIVDAEGSDPEYLVPPGRGAYGRPKFSPDGERLAFVNEAGLTREDALLVARTGDDAPGFAGATTAARTGAAKPESPFPEGAPAFSGFTDLEWSPDGRAIAFGGSILRRGEPQDRAVIGEVAPADRRFTPLAVGEPGTLGFSSGVEWTPDGENVVCIGPGEPGVLANCTATGENAPIAEAPGIYHYNDFDWGPFTLGGLSRDGSTEDSEPR